MIVNVGTLLSKVCLLSCIGAKVGINFDRHKQMA